MPPQPQPKVYPFITGAEFEERVPVAGNISNQSPFRQCLRNAMTLYMRPLLTEGFYNDLMAAYRAFKEDDVPLGDAYAALVGYVQDALAYQTAYLWTRHNYAPTRETGTVNLTGQAVTVVDKSEIQRREQEAALFQKSYEVTLTEFLDKYPTDYPLWTSASNKIDNRLNSNGLMVVDVKEDSLRRRRR